MGSPEVRLPQKTIPNHGQHGKIDAPHYPDIPVDREKILRNLAVRIPEGQKPPTGINDKFDVQEINRDGGHGRDVTVVRLSPKIKQPLTPLFQNEIDGHTKTGGGGRSKKSRNEAKKKLKKSKRQ